MALLKDINICIKAFANEASAGRAVPRPPEAAFIVHPTGVNVMSSEGPRRETVTRIPGQPLDAIRQALIQLQPRLGRHAAVEFASGLAVVDRIVLPASRPEVLDAIIRNKVEGLAPWPIEQSVYGQRSVPVLGDSGHVAVEIAVVSRVLLEEIAEALAAEGVAISSFSVRAAADLVLPLAFEAEKNRRAAGRRFLRGAAAVAALLALILGFGVFLLWQASSELRHYREGITQFMAELRSDPAGDVPTSPLAAANMLADQRRLRPSAVALLNEVSERLPQTVWLGRFTIDGDTLELRGQGRDIPSLIDLLEASPYFRGVNFASATQFNAEQNADVFAIEATVEHGVAP